MINMKAVFALALMLAPMVGHAELSFDSLKEGAAKAAKAVGETTGDLLDSAGEATGKGWKVSAKLTGSRYWPDEALNNR